MASQFWAKQFIDVDGNVIPGVKVQHFSAGTTTLKNVFIDEGKTTVDSQPSIGDSRGYVWFYGDGIYHLKVEDSNGILLYDWDNVRIQDTTGTFDNTGLKIFDTDASHALTIQPNSNLTAARTLKIVTGDAARTLDVSDLTPWRLIQTQTASTSAQIDFQTGIDTTYDLYVIVLTNLLPDTDGDDLRMQVFQSAIIQTDATGYEYSFTVNSSAASGAATGGNSQGTTFMALTNGSGSTAGEALDAEIYFSAPSDATLHKFWWSGTYFNNAGTPVMHRTTGGGSFNEDTTAIDGIRLFFSTGNVLSGTLALYGLTKAAP